MTRMPVSDSGLGDLTLLLFTTDMFHLAFVSSLSITTPVLGSGTRPIPSKSLKNRREFPIIRGTLFWGPYNKDPTI